LQEIVMAEIRLATKLIPTPHKRANVYKLKRAAVSERSVRDLAGQLGLRADAESARLTSAADKLSFAAEHLELTMFRSSGGFRLIDRSRWQVDDRESDVMIDDAAARRLAAGVIKKNKLAERSEMSFLRTARLRVGHAMRNGEQASERTIDVAVAMQRVVDKTPVDGPGGKIIVYLNHAKEVTGLERIWRDIERVHRRNQLLRPPQSAIDEMAEHFRSKIGTIEIQEIRYGYFEDDWRTSQQYLQPAYMIFAMLVAPGSKLRKRTIYVASALAKPVARITPPLANVPPQRPRPS
jgi:hypothetical protein